MTDVRGDVLDSAEIEMVAAFTRLVHNYRHRDQEEHLAYLHELENKLKEFIASERAA